MRPALVCLVVVTLASSARAAAAHEAAWTISIDGARELIVRGDALAGDVPIVDIQLLARDLDLFVDHRDDRIVIRDAHGVEWTTTDGSMLVATVAATRMLTRPVVLSGPAIMLPLDAIADLAGRTLVVDGRRASLRRAVVADTSAGRPETRAPAGWERIQIAKTPAELAEMRRLEGMASTVDLPAPVKEVLPPAHDTMRFDVGLGFTQDLSGAVDVSASGAASGMRINFATFMTYGRDGATYRSGRLTLEPSAGGWTLEAGDLLSDVRGLARGLRFGASIGSRWHPSIGVYMSSPALSPVDHVAAAYRDDVRVPGDLEFRGEALSDGSHMGGVRWLRGRVTVDAFYRNATTRHSQERGALASYDIFHGITAQVGARLATGAQTEQWYFAGLRIPLASIASATLERTRRVGAADTNAMSLQIPLGRVRVMQRYQWTDIAWIADATLPGGTGGFRQLQSVASYSPGRRLQLSYQVATQWSASTEARQWTELQSVFTISRSTSIHAVTGLPDVADVQRFRVGIEQNLNHGFRLTVDYGRLPAFQAPTNGSLADNAPRFLVMMRRGLSRATPAGGSTIHGRVVDDAGRPVPGAVVTLGPYTTAARADGSYRFPHVPAGDLDLSLDAAHLPAQYLADGASQRLRVREAGSVRTDLYAISLHAIHGHVYIDLNGNGQFDAGEGVADVVLLLDNGSATMTDRDGAYGFYNLPAAHYVVQIDKERLLRTLTAASDSTVALDLDGDGRSKTGVDFRVAPSQKPIVFQKSLPQ